MLMRISARTVCLLVFLGFLTISAGAQSISVPMNLDQWVVGEKNERLAPNKKVENALVDYQGQRALHLTKGFGYIRGLQLQNGTIDADVAFDPDGAFIGLAFRVESEDDYELFFLRNGISGKPQALQYTPGFFGANQWQIYTCRHTPGPASSHTTNGFTSKLS